MSIVVCLHVRQSAGLSFDSEDLLIAHLYCDDCAERLGFLLEQTADARRECNLARRPGPAIAA